MPRWSRRGCVSNFDSNDGDSDISCILCFSLLQEEILKMQLQERFMYLKNVVFQYLVGVHNSEVCDTTYCSIHACTTIWIIVSYHNTIILLDIKHALTFTSSLSCGSCRRCWNSRPRKSKKCCQKRPRGTRFAELL